MALMALMEQSVCKFWQKLDHYGVLGIPRDSDSLTILCALHRREQLDVVRDSKQLTKRLEECKHDLLDTLEKKLYDSIVIPRRYVCWQDTRWIKAFFDYTDLSCWSQLILSISGVIGGIVLTIFSGGILAAVGGGLVCSGMSGLKHVLSEEARRNVMIAQDRGLWEGLKMKWVPFIKSVACSFVSGTLASLTFGAASVAFTGLAHGAIMHTLVSGLEVASCVFVFNVSHRLGLAIFEGQFLSNDFFKRLLKSPRDTVAGLLKCLCHDLVSALFAGVLGAFAILGATEIAHLIDTYALENYLSGLSLRLLNMAQNLTHSFLSLLSSNIAAVLTSLVVDEKTDPLQVFRNIMESVLSSFPVLVPLALSHASVEPVIEQSVHQAHHHDHDHSHEKKDDQDQHLTVPVPNRTPGCIGLVNHGQFFCQMVVTWRTRKDILISTVKRHGEFCTIPSDAKAIKVKLQVLRNPFSAYKTLFFMQPDTPPRMVFELNGLWFSERVAALTELGEPSEAELRIVDECGWPRIV